MSIVVYDSVCCCLIMLDLWNCVCVVVLRGCSDDWLCVCPWLSCVLQFYIVANVVYAVCTCYFTYYELSVCVYIFACGCPLMLFLG